MSPLWKILPLWGCLAAESAWGQVILDGTIGPAGPLEGPHFQVGADLGRKLGPNLFHSFDTFNLRAGESASFSGPADVRNVLSRVTGGSPSSIDGLLRSTILGANFFLLNPNGVLFGPNARLDLTGSFAVSSAGSLRLADGGSFNAVRPAESVLTTADPSAFGFLDRPPGEIALRGSDLSVPEGKSLSLVGGDISLEQATVLAPGGRLNMVSAQSATEVRLAAGDPGSAVELDNLAGQGRIDLTGRSGLDVSGAEAGQIVIRGGQLSMVGDAFLSGPRIAAEGGQGARPGPGIDLRLTDEIFLGMSSEISAGTHGDGPGGSISLQAGQRLHLDRWSQVASRTSGSGDGGDISLSSPRVELVDGGKVAAETSGAGQGGSITLEAGQVQLDRGGEIATLSTRSAAGAGGDIRISAERLSLNDDSHISARTAGNARGGDVDVQAGTIAVSGKVRSGNQLTSSTISTIAGYGRLEGSEPLLEGRGGDVRVRAESLRLADGGQLATEARQDGRAGNLAVTAKEITIDGGGVDKATAIASRSGALNLPGQERRVGKGTTGDVEIQAAQLTIVGGGEVACETANGLDGSGQITITAETVHIEGLPVLTWIQKDLEVPAGGILSSVHIDETPQAAQGGIALRAGKLTLENVGTISTFLRADNQVPGRPVEAGQGGGIDIEAGAVLVSGQGSKIHTLFEGMHLVSGAGGDIAIRSPDVRVESGGRIITLDYPSHAAAFNPAGISTRAGDLSIQAEKIVVTGSAADVPSSLGSIPRRPSRANGGLVRLETGYLELSDGAELSIWAYPEGRRGAMLIRARDVVLTGGSRIFSDGRLGEDLTIQASRSITLEGGSRVIVQTTFTPEGSIGLRVIAPEIRLSGPNTGFIAIPDAYTFPAGQEVSGSDLVVQTRFLTLADGALISANTLTMADSGSIRIGGLIEGTPAERIILSGAGTGIISESPEHQVTIIVPRFGGDLEIDTRELLVTGQSRISTAIHAPGQGASIRIRGDLVQVTDGGQIVTSAFASGQGGNTEIETGRLLLRNGGRISASSESTAQDAGRAGQVVIHARDSVTLESQSAIVTAATGADGGDIFISAGREVELLESEVTARAQRNGGNITVLAPGRAEGGMISKAADRSMVYLRRSALSADSSLGQGGNITLDPRFLVLKESRIVANATLGNGGEIDVVSDFFLQSASLISASSELGLPGSVNIVAPDLDLTGTLVPLSVSLLESESGLPAHCAQKLPGNWSSFVVLGQAALVSEPSGWLSSPELEPSPALATGQGADPEKGGR